MTIQALSPIVADSIVAAIQDFSKESDDLMYWRRMEGVGELIARLVEQGFYKDMRKAIKTFQHFIGPVGRSPLRAELNRFFYRLDQAGALSPKIQEDDSGRLPKAAIDGLVLAMQYYEDADFMHPESLADKFMGVCEILTRLAERGFVQELQPVLEALTQTLLKRKWQWRVDLASLEERIIKVGGPEFVQAARAASA